jgi:hypothetical protein
MMTILGETAQALERGAQAGYRGAEAEMLHWRREAADGRLQRGLAITAAAFAVLNGGEAFYEHLRGSFAQRWMWTPVWLSPIMAGAGIGAYFNARVARWVLPWVSLVTLAEGMAGFFFHLRGIARMAGHFRNLRFNVTMGPPIFAPLLFCSVGMLGLLAAFMRRETPRRHGLARLQLADDQLREVLPLP